MAKLKVGFFSFTCCEGCMIVFMEILNKKYDEYIKKMNIVHFRQLRKVKKISPIDIAFIEGAATTPEHIELLKKIRETSKIVIALGACAISGNFFAEITPKQRKKLAPKIYDENYRLKAEFLLPVEKFIKIDEKKCNGCRLCIPNCPER